MAGGYGARTTGTDGRLFADPQPGPDETSFQIDNTSEQYYNSAYYKLHQSQLQPVPPPRVDPPRMQLADILPAAMITQIQTAGRITFHAVGDTGAARVAAIPNEGGVADAMARDVAAGGPDTPAFFFHLGDVIYNFGEAQYYYDQFYEPFRAYDRPIFAIPGNHDGFPESAAVTTLAAFLTNFCAVNPGPSPNAGGLVRSTMTQPGAYFTLDAPFVSLIGLYTNVLEGPGVISTQGGTYSSPINDDQLNFLISELTRLKTDPDRLANRRAVVIACHHPPASADEKSRRLDRAVGGHRQCLPGGGHLAGRGSLRSRPPLPALHAEHRHRGDPLCGVGERRLRPYGAAEPVPIGIGGRLHPLRRTADGLRLPGAHRRRHRSADADHHLPRHQRFG